MAKTVPLWLKADSLVPVEEGISVAFPKFCMQHPRPCAERLTELGYNALLLGMHEALQERVDWPLLEKASLEKALTVWKESHHLILKPHLHFSGCPKDPNFLAKMHKALQALCQRLPFLDAIFFESGLLHPAFEQHPLAFDATRADLVLEEMRAVEEALAGRAALIFYVPTDRQNPKREVTLLSTLCHEAGSKTAIAFSARHGAPWQDYLPLHPFWRAAVPSAIPIVNTGSIGLGNGRWPALPFDLFERCLTRPHFAAPIALSPYLPDVGGTLECSLWIGAQMAKTALPSELLAEQWLKWRKPELDYESWRSLMEKGRAIALQLAVITSLKKDREWYRLQIESLLARLKCESLSFESEYFTAFASEVQSLLVEAAKDLNVSLFSSHLGSFQHSRLLEENSFHIK